MAPEEPHLNAGAAESAHVQATPSPASNDAPPSSQSCQSCNPVKNHSSSDSRPFVVPSPTLRPLRSLREIISRQARQVRQEDIGLGAFSCLPFRVFRVFRSSRPPLPFATNHAIPLRGSITITITITIRIRIRIRIRHPPPYSLNPYSLTI